MNVDAGAYTVDAWAEMSGRRYLDIPFMQPYAHYMNGEGIYFMPEVGAPCWVCSPSEGDKTSFVLGFGSAYDADGTYKNLKRGLNPGDIFMGTRDDNFLLLRRGGVLQLGGGPLSQRMYLPVGNWIRDVCENYHLNAVGGELKWQVHRTETDADGNQNVSLGLYTKEKANDADKVAHVELGYMEDDGDAAYRLRVYESGDDGAALQAQLVVKKTGEVSWAVQDAFNVTAAEDINLVSSSGNVVVQSSSGFAEMLGETAVNLKSKAGIVAECATGSLVQLGGPGAVNPAADATLVAAALQQLAGAISGAAVGVNDGGALFKSNLIAALAGWPSNLGAAKVTVE